MKKQLFCLILLTFCLGCHSPSEQSQPIQKAADSWRYPSPKGVISDETVASSIKLSLNSNYTVWRESLQASVEATFENITPSFVYIRFMPHLFIYDAEKKVPLYWSNIDMSFAESVGAGTMSIISLPANGKKVTSIPIDQVKFASVDSQTWPEYTIYETVPSGRYLMRLECDFYDNDDKLLGTLLSNFVEFTTVLTAPEVVRTSP